MNKKIRNIVLVVAGILVVAGVVAAMVVKFTKTNKEVIAQ